MSTLTKNKKPNAFVRLTKHSEFTIGLVVIALFLLATFLTKNFFGSYNLKNLTKQGAIVGVLAVAQTFIIITSGIASRRPSSSSRAVSIFPAAPSPVSAA